MFCQTCGKSLAENAQFCNGCGAQTQAAQPAARPAAPPPPPPPMAPPMAQQFAPPPAPQMAPPPPRPPGMTPPAPPPMAAAPPPVPHMAAAPPPPPPVFEGVCLHCGHQMGFNTMFCGKCGKQAGTVPPPKPRRFCQGCGNELSDELRFCQSCGRSVPGAAFRASTEGGAVALDSVGGFIKGLPIGKQRLAFMAASLIGIICVFMPMFSFKGDAGYMKQMITMAFGTTSWMADAVGWVVLACFAVPVVLAVLGDRAGPMGKLKFFCIPCGAIVALIDIIRLTWNSDIAEAGLSEYVGLGFGMYLILLPAVALCVLPFIKPLEM